MLTYFIIAVTFVISIICFSNNRLFDKLSLKPYRVIHAKEWYRIITHGFVHADWIHLLVNMFTFWSFGQYMESAFQYLGFGIWGFLLLYFGGMFVASISDLIKYRNTGWYTSIGASGAVSSVLFHGIKFCSSQPYPSPVSFLEYFIFFIVNTWLAAEVTT